MGGGGGQKPGRRVQIHEKFSEFFGVKSHRCSVNGLGHRRSSIFEIDFSFEPVLCSEKFSSLQRPSLSLSKMDSVTEGGGTVKTRIDEKTKGTDFE